MGIIADLLGGVSEDLYDKIPGDVKDFYTSPLITPTADGQAGNIRDSQYAYLTSPDITFKPFTVTGPSGNIDVTVDEFGQASTNYELAAQQERLRETLESNALQKFTAPNPLGTSLSDAAGKSLFDSGQQRLGTDAFGRALQADAARDAFQLGSNYMGNLGTPRNTREQDIYNRIRATQTPEENRKQLALQEQLSNQGRLGVQTAMFGGTPEQLAISKAQEEAKLNASLAAIEQAQKEQVMDAELAQTFTEQGSSLARQRLELADLQETMAQRSLESGLGMYGGKLDLQTMQQELGMGALEGSYAPELSLLSGFAPALDVASLADVARRQQGQYDTEVDAANLAGIIGQKQGLADLYSGMFAGAGGLLGSITGAVPTTIKGFAELAAAGGIKGIWSSDVRLKDNIKYLDNYQGINFYTWDWNKKGKKIANNDPTTGVIAQELKNIIPEAVRKGTDGYLRVDYNLLFKKLKI